MSAALLGKPMGRTKPLFWEYGRNEVGFKFPGAPADRSPNVAMREGGWKLLVNADGSRTELYQILTDPNETQNLADTQPEVTEKMKATALAWRVAQPKVPAAQEP